VMAIKFSEDLSENRGTRIADIDGQNVGSSSIIYSAFCNAGISEMRSSSCNFAKESSGIRVRAFRSAKRMDLISRHR